MEPNRINSTNFNYSIVQNTASANGRFELEGETYVINVVSSQNTSRKEEILNQLNEIIQRLSPIINDSNLPTTHLAFGNGQLIRTYVRKDGRQSTKTYDIQKLKEKLAKANNQKSQTNTHKKIQALRASIEFLNKAAQQPHVTTIEISKLDRFKKPEKLTEKFLKEKEALVNEINKHIGDARFELRAVENALLKSNLSEQEKDKLMARKKVLHQELKHHYAKQDELYDLICRETFGSNFLTRAYNRTSHFFKNEIPPEVLNEYQNLIQLLKQKYPDNIILHESLSQLSDLQSADIYRGYCFQISQEYDNELQELLDSGAKINEKHVLAIAEKFEKDRGISNPKWVALRLLEHKLTFAQERIVGDKVKPTLINVGFTEFLKLAFSNVRSDDFTQSNRKYGNMFSKALFNKKLTKPVAKHSSEKMVIPPTLSNGVYLIDVVTNTVGSRPGLARLDHVFCYIKINEHQSYIYEPNFGLISTGSSEKTTEILKQIQDQYAKKNFDVSNLLTEVFQFKSPKNVKSPNP